MTNRYERIKMQRRMQRRIRLVVEERRMAFNEGRRSHAEQAIDPEQTIEITPPAGLRAIGRVAIGPA